MEYVDFRNLAQGAQAVGFLIALLAGGFWAVYILFSSKELLKKRSEAMLLKSEAERRKGLGGSITCKMGKRLSNKNTPIFIDVVIENFSTEIHTLDWNSFPLKIAEVDFDYSKEYCEYDVKPITKLQEIRINPEGENTYATLTTSSTLLPESKKNLKFLWHCPADGIYLFSISAPLSKTITKYIHENDSDNHITVLRNKNESKLPNYEHKFDFHLTTYFQVSNDE
jgi:hypothetical protein